MIRITDSKIVLKYKSTGHRETEGQKDFSNCKNYHDAHRNFLMARSRSLEGVESSDFDTNLVRISPKPSLKPPPPSSRFAHELGGGFRGFRPKKISEMLKFGLFSP